MADNFVMSITAWAQKTCPPYPAASFSMRDGVCTAQALRDKLFHVNVGIRFSLRYWSRENGRWLAGMLIYCLFLGISNAGGTPKSTIPPEEKALHNNLRQLIRVIKQSKRIEVATYGKTGAQALKSTGDEVSITEAFCTRLLQALKTGKVKLPKAVATLFTENDSIAYFNLISGIAEEYWKDHEPRMLEQFLRNSSEPEPTREYAARRALEKERQAMELHFLNREDYVPLSSFGYWEDEIGDSPGQSSGPVIFKLYENGQTVDGRKRYLQFLYYPTDPWRTYSTTRPTPPRSIRKAEYDDLTPDRGFGFAGSLGPFALRDREPYVTFGVLDFEGKPVPWQILKGTTSLIPYIWGAERWQYVVKINSDLGMDSVTSMTCSFVIQ